MLATWIGMPFPVPPLTSLPLMVMLVSVKASELSWIPAPLNLVKDTVADNVHRHQSGDQIQPDPAYGQAHQ